MILHVGVSSSQEAMHIGADNLKDTIKEKYGKGKHVGDEGT